MVDRDFVFNELGKIFGVPCDCKQLDDYMNEHCSAWCRRFCGKVDASRCWREYFSVRERTEK